jgi:hypothetical protein
MVKEELDKAISEVDDIIENMSIEEIKEKMIEQKNETMKEIQDKFPLVLEINNFIEGKSTEDIKLIIMLLINKLEERLTNEPIRFCCCDISNSKELGGE